MTKIFKASALVLVAALALGGGVAAAIHSLLLVKYRAEIGIPVQGDVALFRKAQDTLRSVDWLERYRGANANGDDADYETLHSQLSLGRDEPVAFQHSFAVSRTDTRDLPDVIAAKLVEPDEVPNSLVVVSATTRDLAEAIQLARFAAGFGRDVLVRHALQDLAGETAGKGAVEMATAQSQLITLSQDIDSLSRRIEAVRKIGDEYGTRLGEVVGGTQVQVDGARYLSPVQQLIGLESERVDKMEELQTTRERLKQFQALVAIATDMNGQLRAPVSAIAALSAISSAAEKRLQNAQSEPEKAAAAMAIQDLTKLRVKLVDAPLSPIEPVAVRQSPPRSLIILAGIVAGFAVWLLAMKGLTNRRANANALEPLVA